MKKKASLTTSKKRVVKESTIVNKIIKYLGTVPECFSWKEHGGMYGKGGIPDIICCLHGFFLAFEVKRPGIKKASELQQAVINKINTAKGKAFLVNSVEEVKEVIESFGRKGES
jgi:uncharacterized protein YlzI (FlbEa/FlbD family)